MLFRKFFNWLSFVGQVVKWLKKVPSKSDGPFMCGNMWLSSKDNVMFGEQLTFRWSEACGGRWFGIGSDPEYSEMLLS